MHTGYWWESQKERATTKIKTKMGDNISMDLEDVGWDGMDWMDLAQDREHWRALVIAVMKLWVSREAEKLLSSCTTGGPKRRIQLNVVSYTDVFQEVVDMIMILGGN
jgi:hypothetical protein